MNFEKIIIYIIYNNKIIFSLNDLKLKVIFNYYRYYFHLSLFLFFFVRAIFVVYLLLFDFKIHANYCNIYFQTKNLIIYFIDLKIQFIHL